MNEKRRPVCIRQVSYQNNWIMVDRILLSDPYFWEVALETLRNGLGFDINIELER